MTRIMQPVLAGITQPKPPPPITELADLRQRITNGFAYIQKPRPIAERDLGEQRIMGYVTRYMTAIYAYRDQLTDEERDDMARTYAGHVDPTSDDATYAERLNEYMVAEDIASQTTLAYLMERLDFWTEGRAT